jgi:uncharacterized protein (TIGR02284 family)
MKTNEKLADVLNDLIRINNDRIEGYQKAIEEVEDGDVDLHSIFNGLASDSRKIVTELTQQVQLLGEEPAEGTTGSGKIYRVWMDIKDSISTDDRKSVLQSCEFGEDAAQKAYDTAMESDAEMSPDIRQMIAEQQSVLNRGHDLIKEYRYAHEAVS